MMKQTLLTLLLAMLSVASFAVNGREVVIHYEGDTATVAISDNIAHLITAQVEGADVVLEQCTEVMDEISYRLSGKSDNGSFTHVGNFKITLILEGLELTSGMGAAMHIKNGKRIAVVVKEDTENTLTDKLGGEQKACMVVKGHAEFQGGGMLTIHGRGRHALKSDEYVELKPTMGNLSLISSVKDGIHTDGYVLVKGGMLNITTIGSGYWDEEDQKTKAPSCINAVGDVEIHGGTLNLLSKGNGGKGIGTDCRFIMTGGSLDIETQGERYVHELYEGNHADADNIPDSLKNSPKAIKSDRGIDISGGSLSLFTHCDGGEGLESKDTLTIRGGILRIDTYDDCLNASGDIRISGGDLLLNSFNNDGIDTNESLYIEGGNIVTLGNYLYELGIDVNDKSKRKKLYLTGGTLVCIGGTRQVVRPYTTDGAQPTLYYRGKVSVGIHLLLRCTTTGKDILRYCLERDYTTEAGGKKPDLGIMLSAPSLQVGHAYELINENNGRRIARISSLDSLYTNMEEVDEEFTGIRNRPTSIPSFSERVYDLNGHPVVSPSKGIYLLKGRKVVL